MTYKRQLDAEAALKKAIADIFGNESAGPLFDAITEYVQSVKEDAIDRMENTGPYAD